MTRGIVLYQFYFHVHPMQKGPQHCNVVSRGVSGVVVTDVVVSVVSGNAWPPCATAVDGFSSSSVT